MLLVAPPSPLNKSPRLAFDPANLCRLCTCLASASPPRFLKALISVLTPELGWDSNLNINNMTNLVASSRLMLSRDTNSDTWNHEVKIIIIKIVIAKVLLNFCLVLKSSESADTLKLVIIRMKLYKEFVVVLSYSLIGTKQLVWLKNNIDDLF